MICFVFDPYLAPISYIQIYIYLDELIVTAKIILNMKTRIK